MPGYVDGEVVVVLSNSKKIENKQMKASKDDPKILLKSNSSRKTCVHMVDAVYSD
jgi:hypothetical protein